MTKTFWVALLCSGIALAQQTPSFNLTVSGEKTWTISLGLGSASLLSKENLTPGQPALTQTLRAVIEGKALGFITLRASFNDQLDVGFQDFLLTVDRAPWTGELGRFVVGTEGEGLGVYNKRVLGARAAYTGDGVSFGALVTRVEGVSESRTFRGERGQGEALFTTNDPDEPWRTAPYLRSVEGVAYWTLRSQFVEGLSKVRLRVDTTPTLWRFLENWGLGYLEPDIAAAPVTPLTSGEYLVLRNGGDDLALRLAPPVLARRRIQEAIDAYNTRLGLVGKDRKTYPFVEGSDLETRFLSELAPFLAVGVDEDIYPFPAVQYRRYLALGERNVIEGTVEVWIRRPGETEFRPSTDPDLADYTWALLPKDGVLRISFPEAFFAGGALRAAFAYQREGSAFPLGSSVVPGSERAYLNGRRLTQGKDYTVDYASGILLLFAPLGPEDELKVDYERQRGGLGVVTDYERTLFGLTVRVPGWDGFKLGLYRAMDIGTPRPTTHTMPNTHTVAALAIAGTVMGWTYSLSLAGSENVFPADDNARVPSPNEVHAIATAQAPDGTYVIFAHQNGITVYKDGSFAGYGSAHGLAGRAAYALLPLAGQLLIGTDAGLTIVQLAEATPFDRVRSWTRITPNEHLPGGEVLALGRGRDLLYAVTDKVLAWFGPTDAADPKRWSSLPLPREAGTPTSVQWAGDLVYVGTTVGLYTVTAGTWIPLPEDTGAVHALVARGDEVYAASDRGIRILKRGVGTGWVVRGKAVHALALHEGELWYAAEDGLWREEGAAPAVGGPMTAVGTGQGSIWAATSADDGFRLDLWRIGERPERFPQIRTKIDGRDLARFRDIPAADHTRYGASAGLALSQTVGNWQWDVRLSSRLPGYEEIGRSGRSDSHGLAFTARYAATTATTLELRGRWDISDWTTRPRSRLAAGLDWRWSDGPTASVSLAPTFSGEGLASLNRLEMGWQASLSNRTQAWSWGVTTGGTLRHPSLSALGQLGANVSLAPRPGWTMDLTWNRPFHTTGSPGEETFRAVQKLAIELEKASVTASWQETLRHHLTSDAWRGERALQAEGRLKSWSIPGGTVTPRISGDLRISPADQRWSVRVEADIARAPITLRLQGSLGQGFQPVTERSDQTLAVSFAWDHSGWEGVRASLQWDKSWTTLSHPRYPSQTTAKEAASLRVTWEPRGAGWRNALTLSWKPSDKEITATNRLTWPLGTGAVNAETTLQLKGGTLDVKTRAQLGLPLDVLLKALGATPIGDAWGINAEAGHLVEFKPSAKPQHALFVGVTLAVRF